MTSNWDLAESVFQDPVCDLEGRTTWRARTRKGCGVEKTLPVSTLPSGAPVFVLVLRIAYSIDCTMLPAVPGGWGSGEVGLFLVYREL